MEMYPRSAMERAMKIQEVILRAMSGELTWMQAAHILRMTDRNLRRMRAKYQEFGNDGLIDRRTGRPSPKKAPYADVEQILRLYREKYLDFNAQHFHQKLTRQHKIGYSYTFVKRVLQEAGLVKNKRKRGKHRLRREPKPCFGQMLHIDGSKHPWLALCPELRFSLIAILDDATSRLLYAQLWPKETSLAIMMALWHVVSRYGIPMSMYSDRASWAFHTPNAGRKVDKDVVTHVGRALSILGIDHIPAYSPQARGRSERSYRTHQDRLVNELKAAGIRDINDANRFLHERYLPEHNELYARTATDPTNVFVPARGVDLNQVFCFEVARKVAQDNTVVMKQLRFQIEKQEGVVSCSGAQVKVRKHLDGTYSIWRGISLLGLYDERGRKAPKGTQRRRKQSPTRREGETLVWL
jgi:transposase